jgi:hypothetical protein
MHSRLTFGILVCLVAALAGLTRLDVATQAIAQKVPGNEPYSLSYAAGSYDLNGNFLGGTELMNLVAFKGALYAGIGYWMDRQRTYFARLDPSPGAQIVVLDSKFGQWRQEVRFSMRDNGGISEYTRPSAMQVIAFHRFDGAGNVIGPSTELLVVGLGGITGGAVYTQRSPGSWEDTRIPTNASIRSFALHYDPIDRVEKLYAAGGGRDEGSIYSGVFDPSAPGRIRWSRRPEQADFQSRVMSMVDCDGVLFAAAKPSIYRRNDENKRWEAVYSHPQQYSFDETKYASGFRALTCIENTAPGGRKALLASFEGISGDILRIDPETGAATVELQSREFLTQQWGYPPAKPDIITGYNDIPLVKHNPDTRLFGLLAISPKPVERNSAWLLSRTKSSTLRYELHEVRPPRWPIRRSDGALWAVRAIAVSPFPDDQDQIVYLGGYDAHFASDHNTAWLSRVGINIALEPYNGQ